jgi:adenine-specific DNA-methyltransferase
LRGKVQCIYIDPPYGIKFNSNFQWSTTNRDVKDGSASHITREPEQVKAFRDTWRDGVHSYLTYLRDRLTVARDLLSELGSVFVQISDENSHLLRAVLDEVFGAGNFVAQITFQKTGGLVSQGIVRTLDYILWYAKSSAQVKVRQLFWRKTAGETSLERYDLVSDELGFTRAISQEERSHGLPAGNRRSQLTSLESANPTFKFEYQGVMFSQRWKTNATGLSRIARAGRAKLAGKTLRYLRHVDDFPVIPITDRWESMQIGTELTYVVQTSSAVIQNCILMTTDPGDLVLDPTCGSGTTATVAEQWGRRWITIDTSRVATALARTRIMGARYPFYLLADSREGQRKEAEVTHSAASSRPVRGDIRYGFVYERVPHIMLSSIANNTEIDVIWDKWQQTLASLRDKLNSSLGTKWQEWEIPRESEAKWLDAARKLHAAWWEARIARQKEIGASIEARAGSEYLYDRPYENKKCVRVAGPFTVESLSPHRMLGLDEDGELIDPFKVKEPSAGYTLQPTFEQMILDNLKAAGVQQAHKQDKIVFASLTPWPGELVCGEGRYMEGGREKRAGIFIGPEFGTVTRPDLVAAAREAGDANFDVLIACAFNYEAHASEFEKLGRIPVLKARMNADLHMAEDLKTTGKGNLFVIFGEPDIEILNDKDGQVRVKVRGVDVFDPSTGEVRSDSADGIACWFIDTDYNMESFFVRHAYFLGQNDPYGALRTTLKAEINEEAWDSLHSDTSRPFNKPKSGRIAVKVINHLGDEVMKVFRV